MLHQRGSAHLRVKLFDRWRAADPLLLVDLDLMFVLEVNARTIVLQTDIERQLWTHDPVCRAFCSAA
jgi:hypothetical protein